MGSKDDRKNIIASNPRSWESWLEQTCSPKQLVEDHVEDLLGAGVADGADWPDAGEEEHALEEGRQFGFRFTLQRNQLIDHFKTILPFVSLSMNL